MKIKIDTKTTLRSPILWVLVIFLQMVLLYGVSYWAYHSSRMPSWFDNAVLETGIWRVFGKKVYEHTETGELTMIDPALESVVKKTYSRYSVRGYIKKMQKTEDGIKNLVLELPESDDVTTNGVFPVTNVFYLSCFGEDSCRNKVYLRGTLEHVNEGQLVEIWFERGAVDDSWRITQLYIADEYGF